MQISVDISDEGVAELNALKKETGAPSYTELFNNGVTLLKWASEQKKAGRLIASLDEAKTSYKEVSLPILDHIKPASAPAQSHAERAAGSKPSGNELGG
jgi:hypothetical protein